MASKTPGWKVVGLDMFEMDDYDYSLGSFPTEAEALAAAREAIDRIEKEQAGDPRALDMVVVEDPAGLPRHQLRAFLPWRAIPSVDDVSRAVQAYNNSRYGKDDTRLSGISESFLTKFLAGQDSDQNRRDFAWEVKKWGHIQGVSRRLGDDAAVAYALNEARQEVSKLAKSRYSSQNSEPVIALVAAMVKAGREAGRTSQVSWTSKILHWLLPNHVPVYDLFVRKELEIRDTGVIAFRRILSWEYKAASFLAEGDTNFGSLAPATPLRALDKYLWWLASQTSKTR
jgi:hypothetical protein